MDLQSIDNGLVNASNELLMIAGLGFLRPIARTHGSTLRGINSVGNSGQYYSCDGIAVLSFSSRTLDRMMLILHIIHSGHLNLLAVGSTEVSGNRQVCFRGTK